MESRKKTRALPRLDIARISAAAIAVADQHDASGFTIREVARVLHVTPMALYHHVKDKKALAGLAISASINGRPLSAPTGLWQEDLYQMALWIREGALAHPALHELQRSYQIFTPEILRLTDRWLSLWQQSGLDLQRAVLAASTSSAAIAGLVAEESIRQGSRAQEPQALALLPNARLLLKASYNSKLTFELGVRAVISGLHAQLSSNAAIKGANLQPSRGRRSR